MTPQRKALAEASRVDEVKTIHDKAIAMKLYAKQAKDMDLIRRATEIRLRAERRGGELLADLKKNGGRANKGNPDKIKKSTKATFTPPTLTDLGVTKQQSSRWQKIAALPEAEFESRVDIAVGKAEASIDAASKPKRKPRTKSDADHPIGVVSRWGVKVRKLMVLGMRAMLPPERVEFLQMVQMQVDDLTRPADAKD